MKLFSLLITCLILPIIALKDIRLTITSSTSLDSLGACQGISYQQGKAYLYGDREVGIIRIYSVEQDSLYYSGKEIKLTVEGKDAINHPTGIAWHPTGPTFIGNSTRLNPEGTQWKAVIHLVNWSGLLRTATLDGNLLNTIDDDACIQGTRPEYVRYQKKWYVATADYGNQRNEVRLYDPIALANAKKTSDPGVLVKKFSCSPWVQNLHWIPEKGVLVLIQNQIEGRRWRFTFLDLNKSIASGHEYVLNRIDIDKSDELEGFSLLHNPTKGIAVTSSRTKNTHFVRLSW